jgi:hypothetical protein
MTLMLWFVGGVGGEAGAGAEDIPRLIYEDWMLMAQAKLLLEDDDRSC